MITYNADNCLNSLFFCFYTVSCPSLSIPGLTYNTPLLYDQYHARRGYSVSTKASFPCDERDSREGSSSAICQNSGNWAQQAPICKKSNENGNFCSIDIFYFDKLF